jgi:hypothetical protein
MQEIINLISWGGGWASRFFYDYSISRFINKEEQNFDLAEIVASSSCGFSAQRSFKNFEILTGYKIQQKIPTQTQKCKTIYDFEKKSKEEILEIYNPQFWFHKLQDHLSDRVINTKIKEILFYEIKPPKKSPLLFLQNWSFPILSELLPLKDNKTEIKFIETDMAKYCWKRWHLSKEGIPIWLESSNKSNISSSHFLVWRLIHEATHLLQLQNYPLAGKLNNPYWLLQMESIAMSAEFKFLKFLEEEKKVIEPKDYFFNRRNVITILLLGFFERSLRMQYEFDIYSELITPSAWIKEIKNEYQIDLEIFDFAYEFHNMPGFMSGYLYGMNTYLKSDNKIELLNGKKLIFKNE